MTPAGAAVVAAFLVAPKVPGAWWVADAIFNGAFAVYARLVGPPARTLAGRAAFLVVGAGLVGFAGAMVLDWAGLDDLVLAVVGSGR